MTGEAEEFFMELLFGSGSWLGLILIVVIALLVVSQVKYSSLPMTVILIFMGLDYLLNTPNTWHVIVSWVTIPLLLFIDVKRK